MTSNSRVHPTLHWLACAVVFMATAAVTAPAQTLATIHSFDGTDGANPVAALVQASNCGLYGTTQFGGANGYGTIFKISPAGALTTVHSFDDTDGAPDYSPMIQATNGTLYGATGQGGNNVLGTIYNITLSGALTTLYNFCPQSGCADGSEPEAALVQATDRTFYGTASHSGANGDYGTVFKISPAGALTTLYSFCPQSGCPDGYFPYAPLVQGTDGNFYGTTRNGGANGDAGTVFKITPAGALTTLYSFCDQPNCLNNGFPAAATPYAGLVQGNDGNFYGTTTIGMYGVGTVFKITPAGTLTILHDFTGVGEGADPQAGLILASDGNFYGTTVSGGDYFHGTIFKITPAGVLTTLYSFCPQTGCPDGSEPFAGLVQDTNGRLYGVARNGGANGDGTVFTLSAGLRPFVETLPTSGNVGTAVKIVGTNLSGTTSVTFNGTASTFNVVSPSLIATSVPAGATSGRVAVTTPHGTLLSNVRFRVTP